MSNTMIEAFRKAAQTTNDKRLAKTVRVEAQVCETVQESVLSTNLDGLTDYGRQRKLAELKRAEFLARNESAWTPQAVEGYRRRADRRDSSLRGEVEGKGHND